MSLNDDNAYGAFYYRAGVLAFKVFAETANSLRDKIKNGPKGYFICVFVYTPERRTLLNVEGDHRHGPA